MQRKTRNDDRALDILLHGLHDMEVICSDLQQEQLTLYLELLVKWNRAYNLTSAKNSIDITRLHLLDSLSITKFVDGDRIIDVGTGAGLPGIPLAIMNPEKNFFLLDSNGKKVRFLFNVRLKLGLKNCFEIHERVENYNPEKGFDMVLTRAFSSLSSMLRHCDHLLSFGGLFCAMKGRLSQYEQNVLPSGYKIIQSEQLVVPKIIGDRYLVKIAKEFSSYGA
ncbi:MAG: 16S rRNA (guanine(527)-N(7))-methyltransferase RsmG [Cellvibrionales bacterium TMED49]|nr:MAG: 16S rRNA (guanine(527)-N(7))-methyltransferase RsmG [Cellvibrionales bacterium TMED49]|tara:strand:- start:32 stop:697 length:666 start_codon:yes stop_codon:yes gene_type:complete